MIGGRSRGVDLSFLAPLYDGAPAAQWASAYLDASRTDADAAHAVELRWRALRESLAEAGADEPTLTAMDDAVGDRSIAGEHGQAIFASGGSVPLTCPLPRPPRREVATWGRLPAAMPLVAGLADQVAHIVVVADRTGADITAYGRLPGELLGRGSVDRDDFYLQKVSAGDWAQAQFQRSAENSWEAAAADVAREVDHLVAGIHPPLLVTAGDVRARALLREHLSEPARRVLVEVEEGGRGKGSSAESLQRRVDQLIAEVAARGAEEALEALHQQLGEHDRGVEGLAATVAALARGQVETLLWWDDPDQADPDRRHRLWAGPAPTLLALDRDDLVGMGVETPEQVPVDSAIVRALVGTGAGLVVVGDPQRVRDGVGAVLRYADPSTP